MNRIKLFQNLQILNIQNSLILEWLVQLVPHTDSSKNQPFIDALALFLYHQSQSQMGLEWTTENLDKWRNHLLQSCHSQASRIENHLKKQGILVAEIYSKANENKTLTEQSNIAFWDDILEFTSAENLARINPLLEWHNTIGSEGDLLPLIFQDNRLYSQKLNSSENQLLKLIPEYLKTPRLSIDLKQYQKELQSVLKLEKPLDSRQAVAVALAPLSRFFVISGGPGTGKTTVLVHALRMWLRTNPHLNPSDILLCAPTGKAKARMKESLVGELSKALSFSRSQNTTIHSQDHTLELNPPESKTLHQVLFKALNTAAVKQEFLPKIKAKLVVVDEVSMVDMSLFKIMLQSLMPGAQILLLGDMYQLPSVEHGAVLGDLTGPFAQSQTSLSEDVSEQVQTLLEGILCHNPEQLKKLVCPEPKVLRNHVVQLTHSFRSQKNILELATKVLNHSTEKPQNFADMNQNDIALLNLENEDQFEDEFNKWYIQSLTPYIQKLKIFDEKQGREPLLALHTELFKSLFELQASTRVLCLQRSGGGGIDQANLCGQNFLSAHFKAKKGWIHGEPVMMSKNHHALELFNGDSGIIIQHQNTTLAIFPSAGPSPFKAFSVDELQGLQSAFAITVHKSQGSEYTHPLIALPFGESQLATREILYTAITRAKEKLTLLGNATPTRLAQISEKSIERPSRLRDFLWKSLIAQ